MARVRFKLPRLDDIIVEPIKRNSDKAIRATVRQVAQRIGRDMRDEIKLASRYAVAKNRTGPGGTTRVRYSPGIDHRVFIGLNDVPVDAIGGDVTKGVSPRQVVSKREGAVPKSFFFSPNVNRGDANTAISQNLAFRRFGPGKNDIERILTPIEKEGREIVDDVKPEEIRALYLENIQRDLVAQAGRRLARGRR